MTTWCGTHNKRLAALIYREWRMNRGLYVTAGALIVLPWFVLLAPALNAPWRALHALFAAELASIALGGPGTLTTWNVLISGALGLGVFWNDRRRGGLTVALAGPLSRREILEGKLGLGWATVAAAHLIFWGGLTAAAEGFGKASLIGNVTEAEVLAWAAAAAALAVAVALSAAIGSAFFVALGQVVWLAWPRVAASLVAALTYEGPQIMRLAAAERWMLVVRDIRWLSPIGTLWPGHGLALVYALYYAGWGGLATVLAAFLWDRAPYERLAASFYFPVLWNAVYGLMALASGVVLAVFVHQTGWIGAPSPGHTDALAVVLAVPLWLGWRWLFTRLGWSRDPSEEGA
ncbi:MAG: hypothetical protein OWU84_14810 [Firmicutes bacterium]|nr:hypothetical protein [Bacillota bacterium]